MDSFENLRKQLPLLDERLYFTTHCVGPLPRAAVDDLEDWRRSLLRGSRSIYEWADRYEDMHRRVEALLGAPSGSVAFAANATCCQSMFAAALTPSAERNVVLTTDLDFRSTGYLWKAQARRGFEVREIVSDDGFSFPEERLLDAIDERVAVVSVPLVSYCSGAMLDVDEVVERAHAVGALVIFDAYQAVGAVPVDVGASKVDALVGGSHKWLHGGGAGLSFLYVRPDLASKLEPAYPGWMGHSDAAAYDRGFVPAAGARRFEQGLPAIEPLYTARAGLEIVSKMDPVRIRARSITLTQRLVDGAEALGIEVRTPREASRRGGMVCFGAADPKGAMQALADRGVDVDTRPGSGIRVSPHPCMTEDECDRLLQELASVLG